MDLVNHIHCTNTKIDIVNSSVSCAVNSTLWYDEDASFFSVYVAVACVVSVLGSVTLTTLPVLGGDQVSSICVDQFSIFNI